MTLPPKLAAALGLLSYLPCSLVQAQGFSYDGNRWYEVEIAIFSHEDPAAEDSEHWFPERLNLSYPSRLLYLTPAAEAYQIAFPQEETDQPGPAEAINNAPAPPLAEPPSPSADPRGRPDPDFKLPDFKREAFIALGGEHQVFGDIKRRLGASRSYRQLFHSVWRQAVLNAPQASWIAVFGGEESRDHYELEGAIRISYNVNRIDLDTNLWLSRFAPPGQEPDYQDLLPPLPAAQQQRRHRENELATYSVDTLVDMKQTRSMVSNTLYYLDHPLFGIIVQVRPYQLPDLLSDIID